MTEEAKKKSPAKKPADKVEKPVVKAAAKTEVKAEKEAPAKSSGKTVTITQIGSPIGRQNYQRATLIGLGLNKMNRTRTLQDTPAVRGMIAKVSHLVKVVAE